MPEPVDVLLIAKLLPAVEEKLNAQYRVHRADAANVPAEVAEKVRALVTTGAAPKALIEHLPKLEIISTVSVGYDGIDVAGCAARGIPVTNTPNVLNADVADLTIALMVMASRRLVAADKHVRDGKWLKGGRPLARKASGKRLGIVGLGRIGKDIARRAEAMDMKISYTNRRKVEDSSYRFVPDLLQLAKESDFLVVIASAGPDATKMINREVLEALGPDGILVNVSRGRVVDEAALIEALQSGKLGGAGLDVFEDEPRVPAALLAMENVVLTPHIGSATIETRADMGQLALDNLAAWFAGKPLLTEVPETQEARRVTR